MVVGHPSLVIAMRKVADQPHVERCWQQFDGEDNACVRTRWRWRLLSVQADDHEKLMENYEYRSRARQLYLQIANVSLTWMPASSAGVTLRMCVIPNRPSFDLDFASTFPPR